MNTDTRPSGPPAGAFIGSTIATSFGLAFLLVNGATLPRPGFAIAIALAVLGAAAVLAAGVQAVRGTAPGRGVTAGRMAPAAAGSNVGGDEQPKGFTREFWIVVAIEVAAIVAGLAVLRRLGLAEYGVAWVALVVGLHFFPLARMWRHRVHAWVGAAMTVLGLAGLVLMVAGAAPWVVAAVAGVGSGVALLASAAYGLAGGGQGSGRAVHADRTDPAARVAPATDDAVPAP